jgi:hypothetical protein
LYNNKYIFIIFCLLISLENFSSDLNALITDQFGCSTSFKQIMKPEYPLTDHQGYSVLSFDINEEGRLINTKIKESMCVTGRDDNGKIEFKKCPFFKTKSLIASKYIRFLPPKDKSGFKCSIRNHEHRYTFSQYNSNIIDNNFILRKEFIEQRDKPIE